MWQPTLISTGEPNVDTVFRRLERIWLDDEAWIDRAPGWVGGSTALFEELRDGLAWEQSRREMYDRWVDVPRLTARFSEDGVRPALVEIMSRALTQRYGVVLDRVSASLYRDGDDSVAWHRDRGVRDRDDGLVAIVSLGGRRNFALRPLGGGPSHSFSVGWGDLVVVGGAANRHWEHAVPKCAQADPRIALMFRERRLDA